MKAPELSRLALMSSIMTMVGIWTMPTPTSAAWHNATSPKPQLVVFELRELTIEYARPNGRAGRSVARETRRHRLCDEVARALEMRQYATHGRLPWLSTAS